MIQEIFKKYRRKKNVNQADKKLIIILVVMKRF